MIPPRSMMRKPKDDPPREVSRMIVGWLDTDGVLRPRSRLKFLSEREALDLLGNDIQAFGEPSDAR